MVFSSQIFIFVFLPLVLAGYYILPRGMRNFVLLVASIFFYAWSGLNYVGILLLSIVINYTSAILIDRYRERASLSKVILSIGVLINIGLLVYYKYFDFIIGNVNLLLKWDIPLPNIILPIGISFFTFQGMSYIVDVYRRDGKVNKNFFSVALYISLFPQLVAGPIVKYKDIDDQIRGRSESLESFSEGIERFVIGLAKKTLIADVLGASAATIFSLSSSGIDIGTAWLGAICYTFQIFFDFSGYSDMAIGLGKMFGFEFMENFNYPYISKSITEFWRRWHISLSTWFREYLYIPLGGNRRGNVYVNLFIVFLVTGIWHGASWSFIIWGIWNGLFIVIERAISKKQWYISIPSWIKWTSTMIIVIIGWVFFASPTLEAAINYLGIMFGAVKFEGITFSARYFMTRKMIFFLAIATIFSVPWVSKAIKKYELKPSFETVKSMAMIVCFLMCIVFIINSTYSPFIYFQF